MGDGAAGCASRDIPETRGLLGRKARGLPGRDTPGRGGWGAVLAVQGARLCHQDMESCNVELIFDHVGHFGR